MHRNIATHKTQPKTFPALQWHYPGVSKFEILIEFHFDFRKKNRFYNHSNASVIISFTILLKFTARMSENKIEIGRA